MLQVAAKDKQAETLINEKSDSAIIRQAINALPEKQQLAFVLTKYEELPQKQVAEIMHTSEGAVEQLVIRAKTNLRNKLEKELDRP